MGLRLVTVGALYSKRIVYECLVKGKDFESRTNRYLGDVVIIRSVLCRDDAIVAGWMKNDVEKDVAMEMSTTSALHDPESTSRNTHHGSKERIACDTRVAEHSMNE